MAGVIDCARATGAAIDPQRRTTPEPRQKRRGNIGQNARSQQKGSSLLSGYSRDFMQNVLRIFPVMYKNAKLHPNIQ
jgi:hypothetical protein